MRFLNAMAAAGTAVAAGSAYETAVADVVMGETEDAGWEGQYAWEWIPKRHGTNAKDSKQQ